jgi:hypothetical protein
LNIHAANLSGPLGNWVSEMSRMCDIPEGWFENARSLRGGKSRINPKQEAAPTDSGENLSPARCYILVTGSHGF